jgi:polyferredoxin
MTVIPAAAVATETATAITFATFPSRRVLVRAKVSSTASSAPISAPRRRWSPAVRWIQIIFLAIVTTLALRHWLWPDAPSIEASCPFGAVETAWSLLTSGAFLRNVGWGAIMVLVVVLVASLLLGRVFCGWVCPVGTLQDGLAGLIRKIAGREASFPLRLPKWLDRPLRLAKALVFGWILGASVTAVVPPLAPFCPYRTVFELNLASLLSLGVILTFVSLSLLVERFWCRYLCPLGALLAPLNYISPFRPRLNAERCVSCGRCDEICPSGINPVTDGTEHPECVRCYACVDKCHRAGAWRTGTT